MHLHAEYKLQQYFFLKVWQKYYQISILGTLATSVRPLPSKTIILTCRNCDVFNTISACKKWTPYLTSFLRYCKDVTNVLYLEYFENAWSYPSIMIASPCRKLWCPNCWNKLVGNSHPYLHAKNHLHHSRFLMILLRNSKLVILSNLGMPGQKHMKWQYHFEGTFDVYLQAIINFIRHVFLETLQRYCKLVILDTLGMSGHTHSKWYYQLVENFCVYLQAKKSGFSATFFWRFCKYMQTCYFGTLVLPGYAHPNW